jgi:hypothetical protein
MFLLTTSDQQCAYACAVQIGVDTAKTETAVHHATFLPSSTFTRSASLLSGLMPSHAQRHKHPMLQAATATAVHQDSAKLMLIMKHASSSVYGTLIMLIRPAL